MRLFEGEFQFL